jgi:FkbM family methyltransferase
VRFPRHPIRSVQHRLQPLRRPSVSSPSLKRHALKRLLPDDAVIVEAGAHSGRDTVALARLFPRGRVHAFEPVPALYEELCRTASGCPNVSTYPLAIGSAETVQSMWIGAGGGEGSSSLLAPKAHLEVFPEVAFDDTVSVSVTTLSAWAEREGLARVDGMWLDMQGQELAALKSAGSWLATTKVVVLEISAVELYEGAPLWPEVREWLAAQGFRIADESWHHTGASGDALAVRAKP